MQTLFLWCCKNYVYFAGELLDFTKIYDGKIV